MTQCKQQSAVAEAVGGEALDEAQVTAWLQANPDLLSRNPELLAVLDIPHPSGVATSLIERQVEVLRRQLQQARDSLGVLVEVAERNHQLYQQVGGVVVRMAAVETLAELYQILEEELIKGLQADHATLVLFGAREGDEIPEGGPMRLLWEGPEVAEMEPYRELVRAGQPRCGALPDATAEWLFGADAGVASAALLPLQGGPDGGGMLVVASREPERFAADRATDFLTLIARMVGVMLERITGEGN